MPAMPLPIVRSGDGRVTYGEFLLQRELGRGGMGVVFLATKPPDADPLALKILNPDVAADPENVARFAREARFMLSLDHPNIVRAHDVGAVGSSYFLSMEFVPGDDLRECIERDGTIEVGEALRLMRQVASALEYGDARGFIHRDVKPENILICPTGEAKLADMGMAILAGREDLRLTAPGTLLGTPAYMAPELARAERDVDLRSDVYSLGCTFYDAITGAPPYSGSSNPIVILQKHLKETPVPPSRRLKGIIEQVDALLMQCLEKAPEARFQTYAELNEAIDWALIAHASSTGRPVGGKRRHSTRRTKTPRMRGSPGAIAFED